MQTHPQTDTNPIAQSATFPTPVLQVLVLFRSLGPSRPTSPHPPPRQRWQSTSDTARAPARRRHP
eukprot:4129046-Prymnesium_polylepis.1